MSDTPTPVVTLIARSEKARLALGMDEVRIERFPFSVGRESRSSAAVISVDRRRGLTPLNDLYLAESTQQHYISREHFRIDFTRGTFLLTDRGSVCGTIVNGTTIGGHRGGGHAELHDRDEIAVGDAASPFVFEFRVEGGGEQT